MDMLRQLIRRGMWAVFLLAAVPAWAQNEDPKSITVVTTEQFNTARDLLHIVIEFLVKYSFQAIGGIIVLVIGWIVARYLARFAQSFLTKNNVDVTVSKFVVGAVKLMIMAFAVIVALGKFGIEIAPLIAGVSVVGFGTSFALQGPLSNYASGITLIFTKPFKVGDIIEVVNVAGEVMDMKLSRTEIKTIDGHIIVVPNKHIIGEIIHNYSACKGLDLKVGVSYKADVEKAIAIVKGIIHQHPKVKLEKKPKVGITEFGDSSINLFARLWCKQDDYWDVMFEINQTILNEFKKNGIEIPFPQRDVHVYKEE